MEDTFKVEERQKGVKARALRKDGYVPGCIYAKEMDTLDIQIPYDKLDKLIKSRTNKINISLGKNKYFTSIDEVQRDVVSGRLQHISFYVLDKNEKASLAVEVRLIGTERSGAVVNRILNEVTIKGYPHQLPDHLDVDVKDLDIGDILRVSDIAGNYPFEFLPEDMDKNIAKCDHLKELEVESTAPAAEPTMPEETSGEEEQEIAPTTDPVEEKEVA